MTEFAFQPEAATDVAETLLIEAPGQKGPVAGLFAIINTAMAKCADHTAESGVLNLVTPEGCGIELHREILEDDRNAEVTPWAPQPAPLAVQGLKNWFKRLWRRKEPIIPESSAYGIIITEGFTTTALVGQSGRSLQLFGAKRIEEPENFESIVGPINKHTLDLTATDATDMIADALSINAAYAITEAEAEDAPRQTVRTAEALEVQADVRAYLDEGDGTLGFPGYPAATRTLSVHGNGRDIVGDAEWAIDHINITIGAASPSPDGQGNALRTITTEIKFYDEQPHRADDGTIILGPLIVRIEADHRQGSERLRSAAVSYYIEDEHQTLHGIALDPNSRSIVHAALKAQLNPQDRFRR